mgnify:CR=1 FL=1
MNTEEQFQKFYANIKLTPAQRQDAIDKHTGVCKKLHDHYYATIAYSGDTKLLIGSYGKHTHIRPARDIDVVFIMPPGKFDQYNDNRSNGQSQLLQRVKTILEEKYTSTPVKAFGKVVVLEFAETKHNVELVPAWELEDGTFRIPNSENGGTWETVDYRKEIEDIAASDAETGKTKFLIRITKKWSENCSVYLRSFQIEQAVLAFLSNRDFSAYTTPALVRDFFEYFNQSTYDQGTKSHLTTALSRATKACDFFINNKFELATDEWKKIFGDDFPRSDEGAVSTAHTPAALALLQKRFPSPKEEYLDHTHGIPFQVNPLYKVSIDAEISKQKGFRDGLLSTFLSRRLPLLKQKKLLFVLSHNVPQPYSIMWKIRNFGDEAAGAEALRGEIHDDIGYETRQESTLYHGEHYVESYFIKEGMCVAVGRILVPIGNNY